MSVIVCLKVDASRVFQPEMLLGTEKTPCSVCADELYISASGLDAVAKYGHMPICEDCAAADPEFDPDRTEISVLPEQMEELRDAGVTDRDIALAKRIADRRMRSMRNSQFGKDTL